MMAVLSESLMYCTHGPLRMQALSAWLCFVQLLAKHAPQVLERIAAQAAVVLLPVLEPVDTQVMHLQASGVCRRDKLVRSLWAARQLRAVTLSNLCTE